MQIKNLFLLGLIILAGCDDDTSFTSNTFIANKTRELKDGDTAIFTIYSVPASETVYHVTKLRLPDNFGQASDLVYFTTNGVMVTKPNKSVLFQINGSGYVPSRVSELTPQRREDRTDVAPFDFADNRAQIVAKVQDVPAAQKHQAIYTFQHARLTDTNATSQITVVLADTFGECGDYVRCEVDGSITTTKYKNIEVERTK